jgi:sporulation protein YlmC with PRC-barrel domain
MKPLNIAPYSELEAKKVLDIVGHEYGTIKDIFLDKISNRIFFVIVSEGGFAGSALGSDYVAIPWHSLNVNPNTFICTLRIDRGVVNKAPRIDYKELKDGSTEVVEQIFNYYGRPDFWNRDTNMNTVVSAEPVPDKHQSLKGSEKQTQNYPDDESQLGKEMDFDKLTGKSDK